MEKTKLELEYLIRTSDHVLFNCISTPSGLEEWFADKVNIQGDVLTFIWEGEKRNAQILQTKKNQSVRFHWTDEGKDTTYFEMRIKIDDMTGEVALLVTDFCDSDEEDETRMLWDSAVDSLRRAIGG
ncbi:MAG: START-like domain-containing protein [Bacteroidota bacterium]